MSIQQHYAVMRAELNERQWRLFLGTQAKERGYGGISQIVRLSGASWKTIKRGMIELESKERLPKGQVRKTGGGRKKLEEKDATLVADLEKLMETKGDPMTFLKYTTHSLAHLTAALQKHNHQIKKSALARVLHQLEYSLKPNKKNIEGKVHEDRDAQFQHINQQCAVFEQMGNPIISVDCKKKGNRSRGIGWTSGYGARDG